LPSPIKLISLSLFLLITTSCINQNKKTLIQTQTDSRKNIKINILNQSYIFQGKQKFAQCHASSLLHIGNNQFLSAWFGGTKEGSNDVAIWLSRGNAKYWSAPIKVAKINNQAHWNPVLFKNSKGHITLFFKVGPSPTDWSTWYKSSTDNGVSWSQALPLVEDSKLARGPVKTKPIQLSNGTLLAGASDENQGIWNVFVDASTDQGRSWQATPFIPIDREKVSDRGVIQPTLWESNPGFVHMLTRSTEDFIFRSDSEDYGLTWSKLYPTALPNNNSSIDVTRLNDKNGTLALVFNNLGTDGIRTPINLAISTDNGVSWPNIIKLEHKTNSEFSYPAIVHVDNKVYGTYTWNRERIAFWSAEIVSEN